MKNCGVPRPAAAQNLGLRCGKTWRLPVYGWHGVYFCSVGRGLDPATAICHTVALLGCDRVWSMRRGGIHATRKRRVYHPFPGRYGVCLVGRKRPCFPQTPCRANPCRAAYMRPLQTTRGRAYDPGARRLREGYGP